MREDTEDRLIGSCREGFFRIRDCHDGLSGWIRGEPVLSWMANIIIGAILIALVWWLLWYIFSYRRRPFCTVCGTEGSRLRWPYKGASGEVLCRTHLLAQRRLAAQRRAETEAVHGCPRHGAEMQKVLVEVDLDFIILDKCPKGCQFHDEGETSLLESKAHAKGYSSGHSAGYFAGHSSGQLTGMVIGMAIDPN